MKKLGKISSVVLSMIVCICLVLGSAYTGVFAASTTYNVADLLANNQARTLGRTILEDGNLICDWQATGIEMKVNATSTSFAVNVLNVSPNAAKGVYVDVLVDGEKVAREETLSSKTSFTVTIPTGEHTISIIRDTQPYAYVTTKDAVQYKFGLKSVSFEGTVLDKPAEKDLYFEFIGDSLCCGDGAADGVLYEPGNNWTEPHDDSIYNSFGYTAAKELGADCSFVCRGGQGLALGDTQQSTDDTVTLDKVYNYYRYIDYDAGVTTKYDFANSRKPDVVVMEIGANDSINTTEQLNYWVQKMESFIAQVRESYNDPNLPILYINTGAAKWKMYEAVSEMAKTDSNLYTWMYYKGDNGAAAGKYQETGHPSKVEQIKWGENLARFMRSYKLDVVKKTAEEPEKETVAVYVDGVTSGTGTADNPCKRMADGLKALKNKLASYSGGDSAINAVLYVTDKNTDTIFSNASDKSSVTMFGYSTRLTDKDGNPVTAHIIGLDENNDGENPTVCVSYYTSTHRKIYNDYVIENLTIAGPSGTNGAFTGLYANELSLTLGEGTKLFRSTATDRFSKLGLSYLYPGTSSDSTKHQEANSTNVIIDSDDVKIDTLLAVGIGMSGATYDSATDTFNVDSGKTTQNNCTVNRGTIGKIAIGGAKSVAGKGCNVNITLNGGTVTDFHAGFSSAPTLTDKLKYNVTVNLNGGTVANYHGIENDKNIFEGNYTLNLGGSTVNEYANGYSGANKKFDNYTIGVTDGTLSGSDITFASDITANKFTFNMSGGKIDATSSLILVGANTTTIPTVETNISGGTIETKKFMPIGDTCTVTNLTNNISGGKFINKSDSQENGISLGGGKNGKITNLTNNISGGEFFLAPPTSDTETSMWFGGKSSTKITNFTNNITAGLFTSTTSYATTPFTTAKSTSAYYLGSLSGTTTNFNDYIYGGFFNLNPTGGNSTIYLGGQAVSSVFKKATTVIGQDGVGPAFYSGATRTLAMNGGWGRYGVDSNISTNPDVTDCSDTVVVSNTINYATFGIPVTMGTSGNYEQYPTYIKGSMSNVINGGKFLSDLYLGASNIYGKATTVINGGVFKNVYGVGSGRTNDRTLDGTEITINDYKTFAEVQTSSSNKTPKGNCTFYGAGNNATALKPQTAGRPSVKIDIKGGAFTEHSAYYSGSVKGTVAGDIETNVTGGVFTCPFYGGSASGTVSGHIKNTVNNKTGTMGAFYGGNKAGTVGDGIENNISYWRTTGTARKDFYGGNYSGAVNLKADSTYQYAIKTNVISATGKQDKYNTGDVCISGAIYAANRIGDVGGDVYMLLSGGNNNSSSGLCDLGAGNEYKKGIIDGDITVEINNGGYFGNQIYLGHKSASDESGSAPEVTGEINFNLLGGHIKNINEPASDVTLGKTPNVTINLQKYSSIINNANTGNSDKYIMNLIGGPKTLTITKSADLYVDNAEITAEKPLIISKYDSWYTNKPQVVLPTNVDETAISCIPQSSCLNNFKAVRTDEHVYLIGITEETNSMGVVFELNEAITADILVQKEGAASEIVNILGSCPWQYTFMGKTVKGAFDKNSEIKTVDGIDYYVVKINIPTGKFDETVAFTCQCGIDKTFVIDDAFQKGQQQQGDIGKEDMKQLFKDISDYGKEVSAAVYGKPIETPIDHGNTNEFIAKYDKGQTVGLHQHIVGTNLLLADKVSIQLYANFDNIADISAVKLDGVALGETGFTISPVTDPELSDIANYVISIPITAEEMTKQHTIQILCGGVVTDEFTSSVGYYCAEYIRSAEESAVKFQGVSKALLKYIDQVSTCFPE